IIAYSTQTFAELFRLNIGEAMSPGSTQFGTGLLVASADGHWLALETQTGIRLFPVTPTGPTPTPGTPTPTPTGSATPTSTPGGQTPTPTLTPAPTASPAQAINLSTRLHVLTDANVAVAGFIITGGEPKRNLVRGIGPSLANFGVPNPLADPILE